MNLVNYSLPRLKVCYKEELITNIKKGSVTTAPMLKHQTLG